MLACEYITITLKDFLFNAGICGFIKVLQLEGFDLEEQETGNTIQVPVSLLKNFHHDYIKALLNTFRTKHYTKVLLISMSNSPEQNLRIYHQKNMRILLENYVTNLKVRATNQDII